MKPLCPGRADIIVLEHLQHRAPALAYEASYLLNGQNHGRKHQMVEEHGPGPDSGGIVHAGGREQLHLDAEEIYQHQSREEIRHGGPDK